MKKNIPKYCFDRNKLTKPNKIRDNLKIIQDDDDDMHMSKSNISRSTNNINNPTNTSRDIHMSGSFNNIKNMSHVMIDRRDMPPKRDLVKPAIKPNASSSKIKDNNNDKFFLATKTARTPDIPPVSKISPVSPSSSVSPSSFIPISTPAKRKKLEIPPPVSNKTIKEHLATKEEVIKELGENSNNNYIPIKLLTETSSNSANNIFADLVNFKYI